MNNTFTKESLYNEILEEEEVPKNYNFTKEIFHSNGNQGGQDENRNGQDPVSDVILGRFFEQLTAAFKETEEHVKARANSMYSDLSLNISAALQQEQQRHSKEKNERCQQIEDLHLCVRSLESLVETRRNSMEMLLTKLQQQNNLVLCSKVFYSWRLYTQNRKRERFKESMAVRHYEKTLKQKAFSWWFTQLNIGWKHRIELKANMEIVKMQKQIVNLYEGKIQNLEDNLSAADRTISSLQSRHKGTMNRPQLVEYGMGSSNDIPSREDHHRVATGFNEKIPPRDDIMVSLCSSCSAQQTKNLSPQRFNHFDHFEEPEPRMVKPPSLFVRTFRPASPTLPYSCHFVSSTNDDRPHRPFTAKGHHQQQQQNSVPSHSCHILSTQERSAAPTCYATKELLTQQQNYIEVRRSRPSSAKSSKLKKTV